MVGSLVKWRGNAALLLLQLQSSESVVQLRNLRLQLRNVASSSFHLALQVAVSFSSTPALTHPRTASGAWVGGRWTGAATERAPRWRAWRWEASLASTKASPPSGSLSSPLAACPSPRALAVNGQPADTGLRAARASTALGGVVWCAVAGRAGPPR
eukprot:3828252-Rhodomonas_salina.1